MTERIHKHSRLRMQKTELSYGHFGLPGTLCMSFSGNITTLLALLWKYYYSVGTFVEIVTSYAISMAFPHQHACASEIRTFQSYGECPATDRPDKQGMGVHVLVVTTSLVWLVSKCSAAISKKRSHLSGFREWHSATSLFTATSVILDRPDKSRWINSGYGPALIKCLHEHVNHTRPHAQ